MRTRSMGGILVALVVTLAVPVMAQGARAPKAGMDRQFVTKAAQGGLAEVQLGKMAVNRAASQDVKRFGQRMINDHSKANQELARVARENGYRVPTAPDAKHRATIRRLSRLRGAAFDRAYMTAMVKDHKEDVALFQKESNQGKDAEVKAFATRTLPVLREHLQMAQQIASQVRG